MHKLVFVDWRPATLMSLRHGTTHDVPARWFGVDSSTITRALGEVREAHSSRRIRVEHGIAHSPRHTTADHARGRWSVSSNARTC
ncbi:hypothetical protein ACPEIC_45940 [Stenotrophomonas sp. NPDC087984]